MAFRNYNTLGEVLTKYEIQYEQMPFPPIDGTITAPRLLHEELALTQEEIDYRISEASICENLVHPILREVWKRYRSIFAFRSHQPIRLDDELNGIPDYLFTRKSTLGKVIIGVPYVAVVEAKRDDFTMGWAQCSLEMYTIQQLNQDTRPVFGIVSNGETWEVAMLEETVFTSLTPPFTLDRLDQLFAALVWVLESCKRIYSL
jgi:hypothetical protein